MELQTQWKQPGTWPMMTNMSNDGQQTMASRELSENDDDDDDGDGVVRSPIPQIQKNRSGEITIPNAFDGDLDPCKDDQGWAGPSMDSPTNNQLIGDDWGRD